VAGAVDDSTINIVVVIIIIINTLKLGAAVNLLPSIFTEYFEINLVIHSYNTRQLQDNHISSTRTVKCLKPLRHSGRRMWNSLPSKTKAINSFRSDTKLVKFSLLDMYVLFRCLSLSKLVLIVSSFSLSAFRRFH